MLSSGVTVSGQGPLIVFLHSSLSSAKQWSNLARTLSSRFKCINIDLLGYGQAPKVIDQTHYCFDVEIDRIKQILQQINAESKFHLVGHSCGGAIALKMAVNAPENVLSLSLYEPVAFHLFESMNKSDEVKQFAEKIAHLDHITACKSFVDYWNGDGFFDALPKPVQDNMVSNINKVNLDFKGIFAEKYTFSDLERLTFPTVLCRGEYTTTISAELSDNIAKHIHHAQLIKVKAGHMAPVSHPHLVEPIIEKFIEEQV